MSHPVRPRSAFQRYTHSPLLLLIATGALLGTMLPLGRVAHDAGWSPLAFVFWPALFGGIALATGGWRSAVQRGQSRPPLRYSLITGVLSVALPNSIAFIVLPHLGTSMTALMYTLPPLFTYVLACLVGIELVRPLRLTGILVGLIGAALLVLSRGTLGGEVAGWLLLALVVPFSIACGNLYRKLRMPVRVNSALLAGGMLIGAALALLPLLLATGAWRWPGQDGLWIMLAQCAFTVLTYQVYFRFQKQADPVYFSQLGYVMAATGVLSGLLFFGEALALLTVAAVAVIICGITLVNLPVRASAV